MPVQDLVRADGMAFPMDCTKHHLPRAWWGISGCQPLGGEQCPFQSNRAGSGTGSLGTVPAPIQRFSSGEPELSRRASQPPGGRQESLPWAGSHQPSACAARPTGEGPEIPSSPPPHSICCLLRLSLPSQPSPAGKAAPLKGEREGKKEMDGRRGKKIK